mgnify:CR=1 FL=1
MKSPLDLSCSELQKLEIPEIYRLIKRHPTPLTLYERRAVYDRFHTAKRILELEQRHNDEAADQKPYDFMEVVSLCLKQGWAVPAWAATLFLEAEKGLKEAYEAPKKTYDKRKTSWDAHLPKPWIVQKGQKRVLDEEKMHQDILRCARYILPEGKEELIYYIETNMDEYGEIPIEKDKEYSITTDIGREEIVEVMNHKQFQHMHSIEGMVITANMLRTAYEWGVSTRNLNYLLGREYIDIAAIARQYIDYLERE